MYVCIPLTLYILHLYYETQHEGPSSQSSLVQEEGGQRHLPVSHCGARARLEANPA